MRKKADAVGSGRRKQSNDKRMNALIVKTPGTQVTADFGVLSGLEIMDAAFWKSAVWRFQNDFY